MADRISPEHMFLGFLYDRDKDGEHNKYTASNHMIANNSCPDYFERSNALILANCTDEVTTEQFFFKEYKGARIESSVMLPTLKNLMQTTDTQIALKKAIDSPTKQIIIPVTEYRPVLERILGHFLGSLLGPRRNHFVTLHYNPGNNTLSLLDSRPWWISWLYPTAPMKNMFKEGLKKIAPEKANTMIFNQYYQGVQKNDTDCGYWTVHNIKDLMEPGCSIADQAKKYVPKDADTIVTKEAEEILRNYTSEYSPYHYGYRTDNGSNAGQMISSSDRRHSTSSDDDYDYEKLANSQPAPPLPRADDDATPTDKQEERLGPR